MPLFQFQYARPFINAKVSNVSFAIFAFASLHSIEMRINILKLVALLSNFLLLFKYEKRGIKIDHIDWENVN